MRSKFLSAAVITHIPLVFMCLFLLAGCGGSSNNSSSTGSTAVNNTVALTAGSGPNGLNGGLVNGLFTTITVCQHGTTTCATIDNVEVDTGSFGLRLVPSALGSLTLTPIVVNGAALQECVQFGDTSYAWGPMDFADVQISGERAINIPVQVLGPQVAAAPQNCLTTPVASGVPNGGNEDTEQFLGAKGILGIGGFVFDCGNACNAVSFTSGYPYYTCPGGNCQAVGVPNSEQAVNPIADFVTSDNNGVMITLPAISTTGASSISGSMNFGIGTRTNNALGSAVVYALDQCGSFPTVTFNGISYTDTSCNGTGNGMGGFLDTGSNALYVSDATTLASEGFAISDCSSSTNAPGFYCVTGGGTVPLANILLVPLGGGSSANVSLSIRDATALFTTNNAVFSNLASDSTPGGPPASDFWDLGLPFFLGRTIFVGIESQTEPNGFVAF